MITHITVTLYHNLLINTVPYLYALYRDSVSLSSAKRHFHNLLCLPVLHNNLKLADLGRELQLSLLFESVAFIKSERTLLRLFHGLYPCDKLVLRLSSTFCAGLLDCNNRCLLVAVDFRC